ncbi:MAG: hypothetical protein Q8880_13160, partial [Bacteroidota bacterium]|nr:hypothetical protein [Bacteroidota bacterium]
NANSILSQFAGSGGTYSGGSSTTDNSAANQAQAIDQAKSQLLQLQSQEQQYVDQIKANLLEIVNSTVAQFDHAKSQIDADIAKIDYNQNVVSEYSVTWRDLEVQRETDYGKQINLEKQSIDYLNQQIQTNNQLTEAQKATLSDQVLQRQQDILSLEQKIYDQRVQMANATIDAYKQALSTMKDAATKNIDNLINDINKQADQASYKKKLSDAQKSAQDIQNQMNALILDNSPAGKKKLADLKKQLSDQQDSITQMVADNDKQLRIDNLNTQKQAISDYYDNMISDETSFAQMRSDIISANTQQIYDNLQKYAKQIQANVNVLGAGVVNTVIAAIGKVNGYIGNNQLSPITSIASLDTGGYTGSWGSGGKFLLAHEKELMLDKNDTSNVLQIVNVARDFFKNVVKLPDLSKLNMATATTGGNTYNLSINIDKVNGDTNGANTIWNRVVNGLKSMGGDI